MVLAIGNTLIYRDTYEQALADLNALMQGGVGEAIKQPTTTAAVAEAVPTPAPDRVRESVCDHLRRSREFFSQGKWAEAGKELDVIEADGRK